MKIACEFYEKQIERGRYVWREHPSSAKSWNEDCVKKIAEKPNVFVVEGPMCRWKMMGRDASGTSYVKKPTKWMTNSKVLAELLNGVCSKRAPGGLWPRHVRLVNGRVTMARVYPPELVKAF